MSMTRRQALRVGAGLSVAGVAMMASHAQESDLITPDAQSYIDRGLAYLANAQDAEGGFSDPRTGSGNVAITGLAGLALMSGGHHPGRGRFGAAVARAADYIIAKGSRTTPVGYLHNPDQQLSHSSMYQHGFGALFLAEVYGMCPDANRQRRVRDMLEKAISVTQKSQNNEGGWRYEPRPSQADVSVTVAQLMALRAAKNAGVAVPKSIVDKTVRYIKNCQMRDGGYAYQLGPASGSAFPRSAAALVGLFSAGIYTGDDVDRALNYLLRFMPGRRVNFLEARPEYYYYGHYYAALAMWTAGGNYWAEWFPAIRDELIQKARSGPGGIWSDLYGPSYATAMACIILQLPNNYLPIMQK